ncbi:HpsJ family protein [Cyanobium sp. N.Huapi 1H5]|uniref:HpsJ family protein n=1 Tax=Cyanobium sp. N.Huapi 1H5 TaxID=2823719 RepID=UPI0020CDF99E|nr:HpsJ family protein [Cyanobium sp. N.Huapi 1H5]MCP9836254.1 HpsJ family protein [Cyanobium sp. N.Huapi 1H5]
MARSSPSSSVDPAAVAETLGTVGLGLFGVYLAAVGSVLFPLRLLDRGWRLTVAATLVDHAVIPLVGLTLLHLVALAGWASPRLLKLRRQATRLAVAAALGFLLLIPVQAYGSWSVFSGARSESNRQQERAAMRFQALREAIQGATRPEDLRRRLEALQGPALDQGDLRGEPLPRLKQRLLASLELAQAQMMRRLQGPGHGQEDALFRSSLRLIPSALILALAFAASARRGERERSFLSECRPGSRRRHGLASPWGVGPTLLGIDADHQGPEQDGISGPGVAPPGTREGP